jgi:hypothetical protein
MLNGLIAQWPNWQFGRAKSQLPRLIYYSFGFKNILRQIATYPPFIYRKSKIKTSCLDSGGEKSMILFVRGMM